MRDGIGIVFGTFAPMHKGHLDLIMRAKKECRDGCVVVVSGRENDRGSHYFSFDRKLSIIQGYFTRDELIYVIGVNESLYGIPLYPNGWDAWMKSVDYQIRHLNCFKPGIKRTWYMGEKEYAEELTKRGESVFLADRNEHFISASLIRENPTHYWNEIIPPFRKFFRQGILICGTASEGKTTLGKDIARYFELNYVGEWAKEYCMSDNMKENQLDKHDFMAFLDGQSTICDREIQRDCPRTPLYLADSDALTTCMYAKFYGDDPDCALTHEDSLEVIEEARKVAAQENWKKIFVVLPHNEYHAEGERFEGHADMDKREAMARILLDELGAAGLMPKVEVIRGDYLLAYDTVANYIKEELN